MISISHEQWEGDYLHFDIASLLIELQLLNEEGKQSLTLDFKA